MCLQVLNCQTLADCYTMDKITFPKNQGQIVDNLVQFDNTIIRTSLKTAVISNKNSEQFQFHLGNKPNADYCEVVLVFYLDSTRSIRKFISVLDARDVYKIKEKNFTWSKTNRPEILKNKISYEDEDFSEQVKFEMLKIVNKYKSNIFTSYTIKVFALKAAKFSLFCAFFALDTLFHNCITCQQKRTTKKVHI